MLSCTPLTPGGRGACSQKKGPGGEAAGDWDAAGERDADGDRETAEKREMAEQGRRNISIGQKKGHRNILRMTKGG